MLTPFQLRELSKEYINRRIAEAENERLAQVGKQSRNLFGAVLNNVRRTVSSRPQATPNVIDTNDTNGELKQSSHSF